MTLCSTVIIKHINVTILNVAIQDAGMNFMHRRWNIVIIGMIKKNRFFIQTLKHKFSLCESTCAVIILLEHHLS